jgi:hypothetical protein
MPCIWLRHNTSQVFVSVAIIPSSSFGALNPGEQIVVPENPCIANALIDTGATTTGISQACAARANLSPIGKIPIHGVGGPVNQNSYLFHVGFPFSLAPCASRSPSRTVTIIVRCACASPLATKRTQMRACSYPSHRPYWVQHGVLESRVSSSRRFHLSLTSRATPIDNDESFGGRS